MISKADLLFPVKDLQRPHVYPYTYWMRIMPAMMSKNGVFFAVGAIHLVGEKSILKLLKKDGYTITPVLN